MDFSVSSCYSSELFGVSLPGLMASSCSKEVGLSHSTDLLGNSFNLNDTFGSDTVMSNDNNRNMEAFGLYQLRSVILITFQHMAKTPSSLPPPQSDSFNFSQLDLDPTSSSLGAFDSDLLSGIDMSISLRLTAVDDIPQSLGLSVTFSSI